MKSDKLQVTGDGKSAGARAPRSCHLPLVTRHFFGFTLIEMLVVIAILGILAGLAVPALKNLGKSDANVSAARQLLDDVGRARQLALSQRTTVYMVFVPTNFWIAAGSFNNNWFNSLSAVAATAATNLCDRQLAGYTFIAHGALGDQPGNHQWHYLAPWSSLPDGNFIALQKFNESPNNYFNVPYYNPNDDYNKRIYGFNTNNTIPFPTESVQTNSVAMANLPTLPYIAFNYLGQLTADGVNVATRDEYLPLAHGNVSPVFDGTTRTYVLNSPSQISVAEIPPGNSTNISYNLVHIDALTGRAVLEFYKIAP